MWVFAWYSTIKGTNESMHERGSLQLARILLALGLAIGLLSWKESVNHIGNPNFLVLSYPLGPAHSWYHVFREACGDVAKMTVFLLVFFGPSRWRIPITWWTCFALMLGYYAPFWIGAPWLPELVAPNRFANAVHAGMAVFAFLGLIVGWRSFHES